MRTLLLSIGGIYSFGFVVFHVLFWKIFRWRQDLHRLTPANRAIMQILNLRMIYVFIVFGVISFAFQDDLLNSTFGHFMLAAISLFWFGRSVEQVVFFGVRHPLSVAFLIVLLIGCALFAVPLFIQEGCIRPASS